MTFSTLLMQTQLRQSAVACLNTWHAEVTFAYFVEMEFISGALATENPNLRTEVIDLEYVSATNFFLHALCTVMLITRDHRLS